MERSTKYIRDIGTLQALAHPLRMRLLGLLRLDGPATASELGRRLGESSGSTSYHLRQLERFGYVVEHEVQSDRRTRRWRAAHDLSNWCAEDFLHDDAGRAALDVVQRSQLQRTLEVAQEWFAEQDQWPREWIEAASLSDRFLRLRPEELTSLTAEIDSLLARYASGRDADDGEQVTVVFGTFPRRQQP